MPAPPRNGVAAAAGGGATPSNAPAPRVGTLCCLCGGLAPFSSSSFKGMAGPSSRRCRDVLCLIVFALFWAGMLAIGALAYIYGNPARLVYGTDYTGATCGQGLRASTPLITYPRLQSDFFLNLAASSPLAYTFYGICVAACPGTLTVVCNYNAATGSQADMLQCFNTGATGLNATFCAATTSSCWVTPIATASTFFRCVPVYNTTNAASAQCVFPTSISSASDPACVLAQTFKTGVTTAPAQTNQLFDLMSTSRSIAGRWFGDLVRAWWVLLLCAIGVPLILAFIWLMLAKACTVVFVWATIILLMGVLTAFTIYLYYKGGLITSFFPPSIQDEVNVFTTAVDGAINTVTYWVPQQFDVTISADTYKIVAYVFTGITIIVLCIVVALRGAIRTATKAIELGAEALQEIPSLLLFPITTVAVLALFMMWWVFVVAGLTTAGTAIQVDGPARALAAATALAGSAGVTNATLASFLSTPGVNATYTAIQDVTALQYLLIYYFFGLLWTGSFVTGCATLIVAGAVAAWYFGRVPSGAAAGLGRTVHACNPFGCCMGRRGELAPGAVRPDTFYTPEASPVCASVCRLLKYYLGTVALGSFFIAFLGFVRAVLAYVYRRLRAGGSDSPWLKFLCCCVQCCLGCLQRFVELITRNAYIYTAIKGTGFCGSSAAIFGLLVANAGTVAAVTILSEVILFLGKVLIAAGSTWVAWAVLDNTPAFNAGGASPLTSTWLVIVINFFFAYLTASAFMLVFDLAIDTVLICYLLDRGENGGLAAHVDAAKFNEIEREAAAEARAHALGGAPDKAAAAQPQQPPLPQLPTPMYVSDPGAVVAAGGTFSYAHPGRSEVVAVPPAGSAAAYVV